MALGSTFNPTARPKASSAASSVAWVTLFVRSSFKMSRDAIEWKAVRLRVEGYFPAAMTASRPSSTIAGNSVNSPAWAQSMLDPLGQAARRWARTASLRGAGPWPRRAVGGRRERPSLVRITHTDWWLIGVPSAVS